MKRKSCNTRFSNLRTTQSWWSLQLRRSKQAIRISNWFYQRLHYRMKNREYSPMLELFSRAQRFNSWLSSVCILPVAFFYRNVFMVFKRALFSLGWISSKRTPEDILIELKPKARLWQPKYVTVWGYYTSNKSKLQHPPQAFELLRFASFKPPYPPSSRAKIAYKCPTQYWKTLCVINKYCWR